MPGTGFVVGGFADPGNPASQTGGRYINFETGRSEYGTSVIGAKATVMAVSYTHLRILLGRDSFSFRCKTV